MTTPLYRDESKEIYSSHVTELQNDTNEIHQETIATKSKVKTVSEKITQPLAFLKTNQEKKSLLDKPKNFLALSDKLGVTVAKKIIGNGKGTKSLIAATIIATIARVVFSAGALVTSPVWIVPFGIGYGICYGAHELKKEIQQIITEKQGASLYFGNYRTGSIKD